jgi:hypothetical protein
MHMTGQTWTMRNFLTGGAVILFGLLIGAGVGSVVWPRQPSAPRVSLQPVVPIATVPAPAAEPPAGAATPAPAVVPAPVEGSVALPVFSLFDGVGPYRKNGLFESYGLDLREQRSGPIKVTETQLKITADKSWVIWSPDFSPASDATHLTVEFAEVPTHGNMTIGLLLADGSGEVFKIDFGPPKLSGAKPNPAEAYWPKDIMDAATNSPAGATFQLKDKTFSAPLSATTVAKLREGSQKQVKNVVLQIAGAASSTVRLARLGLTGFIVPQARVEISGNVSGEVLAPGTEIELIEEKGDRRVQTLSLDNRFSFDELDPREPVSLRVRHPQLLRYATLGRWFEPGYTRKDMRIDMLPLYVNPDGHPGSGKAKFVGALTPSAYKANYEPHVRQYWPGATKVQEYDATTFTNNFGYIDRDRFFDNPDNCVRLASTGGSDMVSLQIRPYEKFNILFEEMLGLALGKCVEVISAATDNGDIGTNYLRIRNYTSKFKVDATLVSVLNGLVTQVNPQMLKDGLGFDPENSALPNFYIGTDGKLAYRDPSPLYPAFMTKPTRPSYGNGIPFGYTLAAPFEVMPEPGKLAFEYWKRIVEYLNETVPGQKLVFHTGVDQAQCRKNCDPEIPLQDGRKVPAGAAGFIRNFQEFCQSNKFDCTNPPIDEVRYGSKETLLTFEFDGHYSVLGQQWLAEELVQPIASYLNEQGNLDDKTP